MRDLTILRVVAVVLGVASCADNSSAPGPRGGISGSGGRSDGEGTGGSPGVSVPEGSGGNTGSKNGVTCSQPVSDCAHLLQGFLRSDASYCTLSEGEMALCEPCGAGVHPCLYFAEIAQGTTYTYLDVINVDVASRLAYDATGTLVAILGFGANPTSWRCLAGPPDFDLTEAMTVPLGVYAQGQPIRDMCAAQQAAPRSAR
jgi:hypothetical protein